MRRKLNSTRAIALNGNICWFDLSLDLHRISLRSTNLSLTKALDGEKWLTCDTFSQPASVAAAADPCHGPSNTHLNTAKKIIV